MSEWREVALLGTATAIAVALLMPLARRLALTAGITDKPTSGKLHKTPTPYLGGVAIMIVPLGASPLLPRWTAEAAVIVGAAALVACIGLVDDIRSLQPAPRLVVEVAAACAVCAVGAHVRLFGGPLDWILSVGWLVVITNSFNLLDNMDGCAGIIATVTAISLTIAAALEGQILVGGLAAVLAGACVGFLMHNWHPARIFMGDAGSLFLGFLLATVALLLRFPASHRASVPAVLLFAGLAVFDTTLVVISRVRAHRPIYVGGTDHTSHRLARIGLPVWAVAVTLGVSTALCCALGVAIGHGTVAPAFAAIPIVAMAFAMIVLLRMPVYAEGAGRELAEHRRPTRSGIVGVSVATQFAAPAAPQRPGSAIGRVQRRSLRELAERVSPRDGDR